MEEPRTSKMRNFEKRHEHAYATAVKVKSTLDPKVEERKQQEEKIEDKSML